MKRTELANYNDKSDIEATIARKFAEWDSIYTQGHEGLKFISDGLLLNNLRNDIEQLRKRHERLFGSNIAGQMTLFGGEVELERPLPDIMPANWNADRTLELRMERLQNYFNKSSS